MLTAGHLATTPRMVKAADALAEEGYDVSVVSTRFMDWADKADRSILASRWSRWRWTTVDYRRHGAFGRYLLTGIRMKTIRQIARVRRMKRISLGIAGRVRERALPELVSAAVSTRPRLIYGGGGALAATAIAAQQIGVPFALDLEDFHSAEDPPGAFFGVTEKIERRILARAALLTAGSRAIAEAYRSAYDLDVLAIDNVFRLPEQSPVPREWDGILRLYWFGQTVGPERGLEETIRAAGAAGIRSEFAIRGRASEEYLDFLRTLSAEVAPSLDLSALAPGSPDQMVDLCRPYDVGMAIENPERHSQELALTNKSLTYILAGLAVAMTDTIGQHELGTDLGDGSLLCARGDTDALARGLKRWSTEPQTLATAKEAAWKAARRRWHWDHAEERGKLLEAIAGVLR